jgi:hypothetical protein
MKEKNSWDATKSLLVIFNYENDEQLKGFRKSLDKILNSSNVNRLIIVVNISKEVDKKTLPPHFLIYYCSPLDFSFWGKLKDVQLESELKKEFDLLICIGENKNEIAKVVEGTKIKRRISINASSKTADLLLNTESSEPSEMLDFAIKNLQKIAIYE